VENQILDGWGEAVGSPSPVCVVDGAVVDHRVDSFVNFRAGAFEKAVIRGFHNWEQGFRWMTRSGTIRLAGGSGDSITILAHAPLGLLQKKWPGMKELRANVSVDSAPIGEIAITSPVEQEFHLPLPADVRARVSEGRSIDVTLTTPAIWRGLDVGLVDERELSLALIAIGFPPKTTALASSRQRCTAIRP
jgi:hypothetical protein